MTKEAKPIKKFELDKNKIYAVYHGSNSFIAGQFLESVDCGEGFLIVMRNLEEGWASQKKYYINPTYLYKIIEFESWDEYMQHLNDWEEEEKVRKFKTD